MQFLLFIVLFLLPGIQQAQPLPKLASGSLTRHTSFPSAIVQARNVDVWLPDGYGPGKKYPVLYMHDGQMLFDSAVTWNKQEWCVDETAGRLIGEKKVPPFIVVAVWNTGAGRHADYFPQKPFALLPAAQQDSIYRANRNPGQTLFDGAIRSDQYLRFLVSELKPFIDKTYSTYTDRAHTFIAGSSMGGLISLYAICEYPQVFGGAACLSTHWPGIFQAENNPFPDAMLEYLRQHLPDPRTHKLYFDYGTATLDALYKPFQQRADVLFAAAGFKRKNWQTREFTGEDHSERAWQKRFYIPLQFLLRKK